MVYQADRVYLASQDLMDKMASQVAKESQAMWAGMVSLDCQEEIAVQVK